MKKLLLAVVVLVVSAAQAAITDPYAAYGAAPLPTKSAGSVPGMDALGGLGSSLGSAATGIPPMNLGLGIGVTSIDQRLNQNQAITTGSGAQGPVNAQIQAGLSGTQTAHGTTSATGMGR